MSDLVEMDVVLNETCGQPSVWMQSLQTAYQVVCGPLLIFTLFGVAIYLTFLLKGIQFRYLGTAFKLAFGKQEREAQGDISHFQSLMLALAATIGTGNIAGVAMALLVGGAGSIFWMWVTAIIGMSLKFSEALLAVKYRSVDRRGAMAGGPMYFIEKGLNCRALACAFALFGLLASLGGGNMVQANSVAGVMDSVFSIAPVWTGIILALLTGATILGGVQAIGRVASLLVPIMALIYIAGGLFILFLHLSDIPAAFGSIFVHAFSPQAAAGGFLGASVMQAIQIGLGRGLMTSEAGLGTSSIAAAAAQTESPGRQGLVSMTGCILTTVIMCTVTALVLIVTGAFGGFNEKGECLSGAAMTVVAFQSHIPAGHYLVAISLALFGFTTILGYAYYAEKCLEYLLGEWSIPWYRVLFTCIVFVGAILQLDIVWLITDIANGLMAYPNLIGLLALSPIIARETRAFVQQMRDGV